MSTRFAMGVPIRVSFEFFPPGDAAMEATLWKSVERLAPLAPRFVSVAYGADGSTRERPHNLVTRIQREPPLVGAAPPACRSAAGPVGLAAASGRVPVRSGSRRGSGERRQLRHLRRGLSGKAPR